MNFVPTRRVDTHQITHGSVEAVGGEIETRYAKTPLPIDVVLPDDDLESSAPDGELPTIVVNVHSGDRGMQMLVTVSVFFALVAACIASANYLFNLGLFA